MQCCEEIWSISVKQLERNNQLLPTQSAKYICEVFVRFNKPFPHELHFQMTQYTCNICPDLCSIKYKDYYDLFILKSQRITAVCIMNQLVS